MSKYKAAGVDIEKGDAMSRTFGDMAMDTMNVPGTDLHVVGGFGGAFKLPKGYREPVLVSGTDGVGTKVLLANDYGSARAIGQDLVAMSVNDIICSGAKPLLFLDYIAAHSLEMSDAILRDIFEGMVEACRVSKVALMGGETAELKLMYKPGEFDLAGFAVGIVEEDEMLDPHTMITPGMHMVGIASSGVHSNGFSLIHKIIADHGIDLDTGWKGVPGHSMKGWSQHHTIREVLMQPTAQYAQVTNMMHEYLMFGNVFGMAHITGGGLFGNIERILPEGCHALLNWAWDNYPLWDWLKHMGGITSHEMFQTFNMGIGFVIVVRDEDAAKNLAEWCESYPCYKAWDIGKIVEAHPDYETRVRLAPT